MARRNENLEALLAQLHLAGVKDIDQEQTKNHLKVRWRVAPTTPERMYVIAGSGSDRLARKKIACDVRRYLRMDGVSI